MGPNIDKDVGFAKLFKAMSPVVDKMMIEVDRKLEDVNKKAKALTIG